MTYATADQVGAALGGLGLEVDAYVPPTIISMPFTAANSPRVELGDCTACTGCEKPDRRTPASLAPDAAMFSDLLAPGVPEEPVVHHDPIKILAGIQTTDSACWPQRPGFEDYARLADAKDLTSALVWNWEIPNNPCVRALFAAADQDGFDGLILWIMEQQAAADLAAPTLER